MTDEEVRQLDTEELCQWLKTHLDEDDWKDAEPVIRKKKIKGRSFLGCPEAKWEEFGLEWGVAYSLSQVAQSVVRAEATGVHYLLSRVPTLDMNSIQDILYYLTPHMHDPRKFNCMPHVPSETSRSFVLSGRDKALNSAAKAFKAMSEPIEAFDHTMRRIPVCFGISGLGKTRMLEEWERVFDLAEIPSTRLGALVLYDNGYTPQSTEESMPIEASFSWRLLHRLFLDGSGPTFSDFMDAMLPNNAMDLRLRTALKVIRSHLVARGVVLESECLHMFLGIDEYQSIKDVQGVQVSHDGGLLQDLLDTLVDILADPVDGIRLYPMFAGTDYSVMSVPRYVTWQVPMGLLSAAEIEEAVGALTVGPRLLEIPLVRRHLLCFSGVARWAVQYVEKLLYQMEKSESSEFPSLEDVERAFNQIRQDYVEEWRTSITETCLLDSSDLLYLAAFSISGRRIGITSFRNKVSWNRLRGSSVCVIDDYDRVSVPYALFRLVADWNPLDFSDEACKAFILTMKSLVSKVDDFMYDKATPWQLWEVFGAHFYALRINALMILGDTEVPLCELFEGALINGCDQSVLLKPMEVIQTEDVFSQDLGEYVGIKGDCNDKRNWRRDGWVVLNGERGKGVDIFYSLDKSNRDGQIVVIDQRRAASRGALAASWLNELVEKARVTPSSVVCLFNSLSSSRLDREDIPKDSCLVSHAQTEAYYGALWVHPAASPYI